MAKRPTPEVLHALRGLWAARPRAWAALACAGVLALGLAAADTVLPPPLERYTDRSPMVLARGGEVLRAFLSRDDKWRLGATVAMVDGRYLEALRLYEDRRFYSHPGVDPIAAARAAGQLLASGRVVSGASTLTMQAARLLEPGPLGLGQRGVGTKLRQMARAFQLERRYSKDEILAIYLTLAPFGGNLEGVRAASLAYFGKEPTHLTWSEAALLVALPQSPERQRPDRHGTRARAGRDKVLRRLHGAGAIGARDLAEALAEPVPERRRSFPFHAPRLARDLARAQARRKPGAEVIRTELDAQIQTGLEDLVRRHARTLDDGASLAVVMVDNRTLSVRGYLGGSDFGGPAGQLDLALAVRSPGSALKPFIYALAFEDVVLHPMSLIEDRRAAFGRYAPRNFDRAFQGTVTVRSALQRSLNVPAVAVLDTVGPHRFYTALRKVGARVALPGAMAQASLPLALGGAGITLRDLTMLYAGLARGGRVAPLRLRTDARQVEGTVFVGPAAAWYVTDILKGVALPDGWGQARNIVRDRYIAFKTGTSAGFQDAWAVGFTHDYTVGVWTGRADGTARPGRIGRNAAAPLMLMAFGLLPPERGEEAPRPEGVIAVRTVKDLPPALRSFAVEDRPGGFETTDPLRILYPPDGATVLYRGEGRPLTFSAEGGQAPLRWIVNGSVLPQGPGSGHLADWMADGAGFVDVSVLDASGASARSSFRITR